MKSKIEKTEKTEEKRITVSGTQLTVPNGHGGKWWFNMDKIQEDYDAREFMRIYGKRNPNVSRRNKNNIMIVHWDKTRLEAFAEVAQMDKRAVYELPKVDKPSKWAVILYY